jgi:hypothetical protein
VTCESFKIRHDLANRSVNFAAAKRCIVGRFGVENNRVEVSHSDQILLILIAVDVREGMGECVLGSS